MKHCFCLMAAGVVAFGSMAVRGESIWERRDPRTTYLFVDNRARRVGDLLTVVVREATDVDNKEQRALDKKSESGGLFNMKGKTVGNVSSKSTAADFEANATANRSFDGKAEFTSQRELDDRITVTVIDVFPNGNLLVEGTRRRAVSGDERILRVSGVVRPSDIAAGNVVESQFIANFKVAYEGKGVESKFTNQGWFNKVVNHVWPF